MTFQEWFREWLGTDKLQDESELSAKIDRIYAEGMEISKEIRKMAKNLKEQERQFNEVLDGVQAAIGVVARLVEEQGETLRQLNENTDIDLTDEIERAQQMKAALDAIPKADTTTQPSDIPSTAEIEQVISEATNGSEEPEGATAPDADVEEGSTDSGAVSGSGDVTATDGNAPATGGEDTVGGTEAGGSETSDGGEFSPSADVEGTEPFGETPVAEGDTSSDVAAGDGVGESEGK